MYVFKTYPGGGSSTITLTIITNVSKTYLQDGILYHPHDNYILIIFITKLCLYI